LTAVISGDSSSDGRVWARIKRGADKHNPVRVSFIVQNKSGEKIAG